MIVARVCDDKGGPIVASGSCKIDRYDGVNDGWFPIDGFNFGFQEKPAAAGAAQGAPGAKGAPAASGARPGSAPAGAPGGAPGGAGTAGGQGQEDFTHVSIQKQIDTSSVSLMLLAMKERKHKKGVDPKKEKKISADIHVISSVSLEKQESGRFHYTSLMVHLEAVNVQGWTLTGSGDTRPTEVVTLRYDKAAMVYISTANGSVFQVIGPKGWDQTKSDTFEWTADPKYFPIRYDAAKFTQALLDR